MGQSARGRRAQRSFPPRCRKLPRRANTLETAARSADGRPPQVAPGDASEFLPKPPAPRAPRHTPASPLRPSLAGTRVAAHPPPPVGLLAGVGFEPPHGVPSPLPRASRRRGVGSWRCGESRALRAAASAPRPLVSAGRAGVAGPRAALTRVSRVGMALSPPPPQRLAGDHREVPPTPVARLRALCAARGWHPGWRPGWRPAVSSPGWPLCPPPLPCGRLVSAWSPDLSAGRAVLSLGFCCFFVHI